ncbi:integral membrane protein DGCR2/IDD-like isoform X1 [Brienomyrus brachyistius]|uniref:integral membrane protein DGCR2/IDD-like isoform X1 n=1 Tax=Brienomyrus brachyistius TaxID=42636 RepID=UPI0020B3C0E9|nr:integral membrane protein DGCR2/IDD-like isoform X1 [Brienomyrus brachyistius]
MAPKADSGVLAPLALLLALVLTEQPRTGSRLTAARRLTEHRCPPGQFDCRSGRMQCIPMSWRCDGWTACEDRSDELHCPPTREERFHHGIGLEQAEDVVGVAQPIRFNKKCPTGWHHYEKTASCYRVHPESESYWQALETCQRVNGWLATFVTSEELQFILQIEVDETVCGRKDQCKFWVGYQYVTASKNHSLEGQWEVASKGPMQVFLPPEGLTGFAEALPSQESVFCAQLQRFPMKSMNERGLHSWHAENCNRKFPFLCKRRQTCVDITDNVVSEGYYFTPKGDDPCLSCTCHAGEPEMCVAALCERPQGCLHFRKDPRQCCKFTCLDSDGNGLFDSMASGVRLMVSCVSSFLVLSLLLFTIHRLRQRRRQRIETLIGGNLHPFGCRMPGFEYDPRGFGASLAPLRLSDDGVGGAFRFHEPPPPYAAFKYPDMPPPEDPPPPYEASISPDAVLYVDLGRDGSATTDGHPSSVESCHPQRDAQEVGSTSRRPPVEHEDSADSNTFLVSLDTPMGSTMTAVSARTSICSLNTIV